jgi:hypothetical protein
MRLKRCGARWNERMVAPLAQERAQVAADAEGKDDEWIPVRPRLQPEIEDRQNVRMGELALRHHLALEVGDVVPRVARDVRE